MLREVLALDAIFFESSVLQQRHPALQLLHADNQLVSRLAGNSPKVFELCR